MKISPASRMKSVYFSLLIATVLLIKIAPVSAANNLEKTSSTVPPQHPIFMPVIKAAPWIDLRINEIEISQTVQNMNNSVSLAANRPTVVRIYARSDQGSTIRPVKVSLSGTKNGSPLAGSPLVLANGSAYPTGTGISTLRADLSMSFNFQLPASWLSGNVVLSAKVDPDHAIQDSNLANNTFNRTVTFGNVPALNLVVVPIEYTHIYNGVTYPPAPTSYVQPVMIALYPVPAVNVTVHAKGIFAGDLSQSSEWDRLLNQLTALRDSEAPPASTAYFGIVPMEDSKGRTWFVGGVGGLGWLGGVYGGPRAAVGLANSPTHGINGGFIIAHEIGHTLGRLHAPCKVQPADPNFPYPGGVIGQYGLYVSTMQLYNPTSPDIMTYCTNNYWISDYTYQGLYTDQVNIAQVNTLQAAQPVLYVRARMMDNGTTEMEPGYAFQAIPSQQPTASDYTIQFMDASGQVIADYPVQVIRAEEPDVKAQAIHALLPKPGRPFTSIQLVNNGQVLAERSFASSPEKLVEPSIIQSANQSILQWSLPEIPALVRYTSDNGQSWTTLGIDLLGGQLSLDPTSLPGTAVQIEVVLANRIAQWILEVPGQ